MAFIKLLDSTLLSIKLSIRSLSGNITVEGVPVVRHILIYKNKGVDILTRTLSDSAGDWSIDVISGDNDLFRVVIVGNPGEYSRIFEDVVAG